MREYDINEVTELRRHNLVKLVVVQDCKRIHAVPIAKYEYVL